MLAAFRFLALALCLFACPLTAAAQWTRVAEVPVTHIFAISTKGDTIVAGADSSVFLSTDAGLNWRQSTKTVANTLAILAVRMRNGRLYAGAYGKGVFISDDLGTSWQSYNQGLVGGLFETQLDVSDFAVRGDSLYVTTEGAGVYVRRLSGVSSWSPFGAEFEANQAPNVNSITLGGTRLLVTAGGNGSVFFRDPGDPEWTISWLDNAGLRSGVQAHSAAWTGTGWVVGTSVGVFRSTGGESPWTPSGPDLGGLHGEAFATRGRHLFAAFARLTFAVIEHSDDDGANWQLLEVLSGVYVNQMAMVGDELYAARDDGLWRRSTATVSVPAGREPRALAFALAGPQPVRDVVRLQFELPEAGPASLEIFDVAGRQAAPRMEQTWPAGVHEVTLSARDLGPGVYQARLTAGGRQAVVRLVHVR